MSPFQTSPNKDAIRRGWDLPTLRQHMQAIGQRLRYCGMTGPAMHDVRTWQTFLLDWTSIEERTRSGEKLRLADRIAEQISQTAFEQGLDAGLELLRGDVEDVIWRGEDVFG